MRVVSLPYVAVAGLEQLRDSGTRDPGGITDSSGDDNSLCLLLLQSLWFPKNKMKKQNKNYLLYVRTTQNGFIFN